MRSQRATLVLCITALATVAESSAEARTPKADELFHVTGCENGDLVVPAVNLWDRPGGLSAGARPNGKLSGDGRKDRGLKCQGAVVLTKEIKTMSGRVWVKVVTLIGGRVGWFTDGSSARSARRRSRATPMLLPDALRPRNASDCSA